MFIKKGKSIVKSSFLARVKLCAKPKSLSKKSSITHGQGSL